MPATEPAGSGRGLLEISLRNVHQLFNSLDPSPFYDRDLDAHAEHFLVSWAQELPADAALRLRLHLAEWPAGEHPEVWITQGVHHYFLEQARLTRQAYAQLMRQGRMSLMIGLAFLLVCFVTAKVLSGLSTGVFQSAISESLTIVGWVAMWRPLEIYLYDWWPLRQRETLYRRLGQMPVELKQAS